MNDCHPQGDRNRLTARQAFLLNFRRRIQRNRLLDLFRRRLPAQSLGKLQADDVFCPYPPAMPNRPGAPHFVLVGLKPDHRQGHRRLRQFERNTPGGDINGLGTCHLHLAACVEPGDLKNPRVHQVPAIAP